MNINEADGTVGLTFSLFVQVDNLEELLNVDPRLKWEYETQGKKSFEFDLQYFQCLKVLTVK